MDSGQWDPSGLKCTSMAQLSPKAGTGDWAGRGRAGGGRQLTNERMQILPAAQLW